MEQKVVRTPKTKTAQQALQSLMRMCARSERSSGDALRLMKRWGLTNEDAHKVLVRLQTERFIDDARYAEAFTRDKLRLSGWGAFKIRAGLYAKGISREIIRDVVEPLLDDTDMVDRLIASLRNKLRTLRYRDQNDLRNKLIRFGISRGYNAETVLDCVDKLIGELNT
jgi:regulatory protein